jgi:hypothetical protein
MAKATQITRSLFFDTGGKIGDLLVWPPENELKQR